MENAPGADDRNEPNYIFHELDSFLLQPSSQAPWFLMRLVRHQRRSETTREWSSHGGHHFSISDDCQTVYSVRSSYAFIWTKFSADRAGMSRRRRLSLSLSFKLNPPKTK
ncbi:hypothetical protein BDFG_03930 [Blastomyces dermatitidis ATCC 26199]|nr:hypothetical protein BDFG_03930 [Blastomyces dermatitidis ATCC 26199]